LIRNNGKDKRQLKWSRFLFIDISYRTFYKVAMLEK